MGLSSISWQRKYSRACLAPLPCCASVSAPGVSCLFRQIGNRKHSALSLVLLVNLADALRLTRRTIEGAKRFPIAPVTCTADFIISEGKAYSSSANLMHGPERVSVCFPNVEHGIMRMSNAARIGWKSRRPSLNDAQRYEGPVLLVPQSLAKYQKKRKLHPCAQFEWDWHFETK